MKHLHLQIVRQFTACCLVAIGFQSVQAQSAPPAKAQAKPNLSIAIESSLPTAGSKIRQYAFDADTATYFASESPPKKDDHFTLVVSQQIELKNISVLTGRPNGEDALQQAVLETSIDGKAFTEIAKFKDGKVELAAKNVKVKSIRIRITEETKSPLVVREITIDSDPRIVAYRYPIEFAMDVSDAPEMKEWCQKAVRVCEQQYTMICDELASEGFKPPTQIRIALKNDYKGVAAAGGGKITGSVSYFKSHPDDIGAMVHETVHCVQSYRARRLPGWLVEGIADYIRFWKYEPGKAGKLNPERAKYDASYRTTAAFLAFVSDHYDSKLVTKFNAQLRAGKYDAEMWKKYTGKTVEELNQEWKKSLIKE